MNCECGCGKELPTPRWPSHATRFLKDHQNRRHRRYDPSSLAEDLARLGSIAAVAEAAGVAHRTVWTAAEGIEYQMTRRRGPGELGRRGEVLALELLPGSSDNLGRGQEPYDLVWQGKRVNVKTANLGKFGYRFATGRGRENCDLMFCLALDGSGGPLASWLIPASECPTGMCIQPSLNSPKYRRFRYS